MPPQITVQTIVNAPIEKVWECWNKPEHITKWAFASDDWEAPVAENDVRTGGKFMTRMQAKDPSTSSGQERPSTSSGHSSASSEQEREGFDFTGIYTNVREHEFIEYDMSDGRHVKITFEEVSGGTKITETFDPESENTPEMQRAGWQSILDNFKKYAESN